MKPFKPGLTFQEFNTQAVIPAEAIAAGDLVTACDLLGDHVLIQQADADFPEQAQGPLMVARHAMPFTDKHPIAGHVLEWMVLRHQVDTSQCKPHALVYLGNNGKWSLEPVGPVPRIVGKVLVIGPPSDKLAGDPGCGAILLKP